MRRAPQQFIVLYDDNEALIAPLAWDPDCEGALTTYGPSVAVFSSRAEARKAIAISTHFARLCKAQGKPANEDFIDYRKNLHICPLAPAKGKMPVAT